MFKRLLACILAVLMCFAVVGCGAEEAPKQEEPSAPTQEDVKNDVKWPDGNVSLIVAASAGGGTDLVARKVAEIANKKTGENFIVVNQKEGHGAVAANTVYQSGDDALTLGFFIPSFFTNYITGSVEENPIDDFKIAAYINRISCAYICVKADSPYETMEQLMDDVRQRPEEVLFGTSIGSRSHFRVEEFAQTAGLKFKYVEAGKTAEAISALLGGHIEVTSLSASSAESYAKNGDIRILACSDEPISRSEVNENAPTYAQLGYADLKCLDPIMIVVNKDVDDEVIEKINNVMVEVFSDPDLAEFMEKEGTILEPYALDLSRQWYNDTYKVYDSVGETLGVKATR